MNEHTQAEMVEVVKKFFDGVFDGDKWNYDVHNEIIFSGGIKGVSGKITDFRFCITVGEELVTCYHVAPINVPVEQRVAVSEFITRANYNLNNGNFEMDFNDGELRYKATVSQNDLLRDDATALRSMNYLMTLGLAMWMRYGDNLAALLFGFAGDKSIEDLVNQCETEE